MKESINLIPRIAGEKPTLPGLTKNVPTLALAVVFVSELLLISLLSLRIKMDIDLFYLKSSLEQKKTVLSAAAEAEKTVRNIQNKLSAIKELRRERVSFLKAINFIPTVIPEDVALISTTLKTDHLQVIAKTTAGVAFAKTVENINRSSKFSDLTLTESNFDDGEGIYKFTLEAVVSREVFR